MHLEGVGGGGYRDVDTTAAACDYIVRVVSYTIPGTAVLLRVYTCIICTVHMVCTFRASVVRVVPGGILLLRVVYTRPKNRKAFFFFFLKSSGGSVKIPVENEG